MNSGYKIFSFNGKTNTTITHKPVTDAVINDRVRRLKVVYDANGSVVTAWQQNVNSPGIPAYVLFYATLQ